ncbi:hypothetical protein OU792_00295 [Algoriphagus sp. NF]|jgi:hypothetical protein|uniref:hypothetical protein n=1 Tax=Algoriphagus sp. NF TaxID=2992756 RepID=UPI001066C0AB|nr:hypothetical protein [Algoriphagus sp. NF]MDE0558402.1 hypothetical protein [Algoriphagus sp. NF]
MKKLNTALIIASLFYSCSNEIKTVSDSLVHEDPESYSIKGEPKTIPLNSKNEVFSESLIGKNTLDIEQIGWFNCKGSVLDSPDSSISYAVSQFAKSQNECRNGKGKVVLKKLLYRKNGKAIFEVIDEMNIDTNFPQSYFSWTKCIIGGAKSSHFFFNRFQRPTAKRVD